MGGDEDILLAVGQTDINECVVLIETQRAQTRAADILEDLDYYCVDNMPVALMPRFAELCIATGGRYEKVALVTDVREKDGFGELLKTLDQLNDMDLSLIHI